MNATATDPNAPVIEIQNLTRRFGSKIALSGLSLTVPKGIVFGLVAPTEQAKPP